MACHFSAVGELEEMHSRLCARAEMSRVRGMAEMGD